LGHQHGEWQQLQGGGNMNKTILATCVFLLSISPAIAQVEAASAQLSPIDTQSAHPNSALLELGDLPLRNKLPDKPVPKILGDGDQPCPFDSANPCAVPTSRFYTGNPLLRPQPKGTRVADKKFWALFGVSVGSSLLATKAGIGCRYRNGVEACSMGYGAFAAFEVIRMVASTVVWPPIGYMWKKEDEEVGAKHSLWWIAPAIGIGWNTTVAAREFKQGCKNGPRQANGKCPD
jgi:hypothetical protein